MIGKTILYTGRCRKMRQYRRVLMAAKIRDEDN